MQEDVQDIYELSPMQHGLLFDSVTTGDSGTYLIQLEYFLSGEISEPDLERAWQSAIERHPVLRTSFHWEGMPKPLQVVHNEAPLTIAVEDWSAHGPEECERRASAFREEDRRRGVNFEEAPLMRLSLFRESSDAFRLIWTFHHILLEGWSASLILEEVQGQYRSLTSGETVTFEEHMPYRGFVSWAQEQDGATAEAFWRGELAGFESPTHPGIDLSASGMHSVVHDYAEQRLELSSAATLALLTFGKSQGLTLNTLMQGAWALLLSRYAREQDVVFGTVVSGRSVPLEGVEAIVGLFVNILPTRVAVGSDELLGPWLQNYQARQVRQRDYEYLSLADIKRWSEVPAGLPLFESLLVFENWAGDLTKSNWGPNLSLKDVRGFHGSPGHPLMVTVVPGEQMTVTLTFDQHRFESDAIERMLANLKVLLEALPSHADCRLGDLPVLSHTEAALLDGFNDTASPDGSTGWVHEQVRAQAAQRPDAIALRCNDKQLTYAELQDTVERLARRFSAEGVGPGAIVALCVDRSVEMVAALLAILRLGAAYVPLDPAYPAARIAYILSDCAALVLVTEKAIADELPATDARVVLLDSEHTASADEQPTGRPAPEITAEQLAYVIYTSGSTGNPKGVEVTHGSLANFLDSMRREPGMTHDDVLVAVTTLAFDIAGLELYLPLTTGAQLVLSSRKDSVDGAALTKLLDERRATVMQATPATWRMLIQVGWPGRPELKVLCGGEALPPELAAELHPLCRELWNMYGPTETTIWSTVKRVEPGQPITVGHAISNTEIHILDASLSRVPLGVTGELFIGGLGLARGYRDRAELTAEKFVPSPFPDTQGGRLYRTGDLARLQANGDLEILGRIDHQVKIRGFRIELGEVEANLEAHPSVTDAVVLARTDNFAAPRLVAYIVVSDDKPIDLVELRNALRLNIPEYALPSAFVELDELPRTPNGKLDRRALPAPGVVRPQLDEGFEAPRTELEEKLAAIWCSVLEVDRVGVRDNFFDLGGHSLLLMPVIHELKEQFNVSLDPGELVQPTLGQLATLCERRMEQPKAVRPKGWKARILGAIKGSRPADDSSQRDDV